MTFNRSTSLLIAFLITFKLCSAVSTIYEIPIDVQQTHTLESNSSLMFQIPASSPSNIGTFNITVKSGLNETSAFTRLEHLTCHEEEPLPFELVSDTSELISMSFLANSSENNCFKIDSIFNSEGNVTIQVTFSPIETILTIGVPAIFELAESTEKEFAYSNSNSDVEAILVTLKSQEEKTNHDISKMNLYHSEGSCLKSISEPSWLCTISSQRRLQKFSLINSGEAESYEISISEVTSQNIEPDAEILISNSIKGFGSLFQVDLTMVGVLKVRAKSFGSKYLPVIGAPSLEDLFGILAQKTTSLESVSTDIDDTHGLTLKNEKAGTSFYYFVQEQENLEPFVISSYLLRQAVLEVGEKISFYINPESYEYQHIELKLKVQDLPQDYEVTIRSEGDELIMNLYFDTSSLNTKSSLFPDDTHFKKKSSLTTNKAKQLTLSFGADTLTTSVYLSIYALEKGFIAFEANKAPAIGVWEGICVVVSINCLIVYIFVCIAKIYLMKKSYEFEDHSIWSQIQRRIETNVSEAESNTLEIQVDSPITDENENDSTKKIVNGLKIMIKKLKKQYKIEKLRRKTQQIDKESGRDEENQHQVIEINEEETCDICYEAKKTVTFEPCNHKCACAFCALVIVKTSAKCPLCRKEIHEVQLKDE